MALLNDQVHCFLGDTEMLRVVDNGALRTLLLAGNYLTCTAYPLNNATDRNTGLFQFTGGILAGLFQRGNGPRALQYMD